MARRVTTKDKWKAKTWFNLVSPKEFGEKIVGETPATESNQVIGRIIKVQGNEVAVGPRLNQVKLLFKVNTISGKTATTELAGYEMARSLIRSLVRRRRTRIDFVKDYTTTDNKKIRVKLIVMTARNCYSAQEKDIRNLSETIIDEAIKGKTVTEVVQDVLTHSVQNGIREKAKKIFPIAAVEIRKIDFL